MNEKEVQAIVAAFRFRRPATSKDGRKYAYHLRKDRQTEEELFAQIVRENPDMDVLEYQKQYDMVGDALGWSGGKIHQHLNRPCRKQHWNKFRRKPMDENELKAAAQAYAKLPDDGPLEKDMLWVRSHDRVFALRQQNPNAAAVSTAITVDDILRPSNGPAPSKSAVTMLQEALANIKEFWKLNFSERKKAVVAKGGAPERDDFSEASDEEIEGWRG